MPDLRIEDVIRRPIITEKNSFLMAKDQFTFEVHSESTKIQIKAGNKDAARVLLDELSAVGDKFSSQAEVEQLKKTL